MTSRPVTRKIGFFPAFRAVFLKETTAYGTSPLTMIFLFVFLCLSGAFTFHLGGFFDRDQADLGSYFRFIPWLALFFAPALAMRVWAEEAANGTLELLLTLPAPPSALIMGKYLSLLLVGSCAILFSFPLWMIIAYLGTPDHGVVFSGYIGALALMAVYLALGSAASAWTSHQVTALVVGVALCFLLTVSGAPLVSAYLLPIIGENGTAFLARLSLIGHFEQFTKGLFDLRSLVWLAVLCGLALTFAWLGVRYRQTGGKTGAKTGSQMNSQMKRWTLGGGALAVGAFCAAVLALLPPLTLDLTRDKLFTLSDGTRQMLRDLAKPVTVTLYYSPELGRLAPGYGIYQRRVADLLAEFSQAGGDNLQVKTVHPAAFSEDEDQALADGMQGVEDAAHSGALYFGIAATTNEEAENGKGAIPFLRPDHENLLEYDLARLIDRTQQRARPRLGIVTSADVFSSMTAMMQGLPSEPWAIIEEARAFYEVEQILNPEDLTNSPPDLLVLIHPAGLEPAFLYAIDQYILSGKPGLFFIDPFHESAQATQQMGGLLTSDVGPLLSAWGITIEAGHILLDADRGRLVNGATQPGAVTPVPYPAWIEPKTSDLDPDFPALSMIDTLLIPTAGLLSGEGLIPLISSSGRAFRLSNTHLAEPDPLTILENANPLDGKQTIAARLTRPLASAYPDGVPQPDLPEEDSTQTADQDNQPPQPVHLSRSTGPANLVIVADADLLADRFWVSRQNLFGQTIFTPFAENGILFLNLVDWLLGDTSLAELRGRGVSKAPFERIADMRLLAEQQYRAQEQQLSQRMSEIEASLQSLRDPQGATTSEQEAAVDQALQELLTTRQELRAVTLNLRQSVQNLESRLSAIGSFGLPVALLILWLLFAWHRRHSRNQLLQ